MGTDDARKLVEGTPTYEPRSSGNCCSICAAIVGGVSGDKERHTAWHATIARLLAAAAE